MSQFLLLNFEDFGLNQDITKTIQPNSPVCICCLNKESPFINLLTCTHSDYLNHFTKPPGIKPHNHVVCYECHAVLMKIKQFRLQVENSFKFLMGQPTDNKGLCTKNTKVLSYHRAVDVTLARKYSSYPTQPSETVCSETITINDDTEMKNIQIGLDIINKNNQNGSMIGALAQGLQILKTISIDDLWLTQNESKTKVIESNKGDPKVTPSIKEEIVDEIVIKEVPNECNELGSSSKEEKETEIEIPMDTDQSQTTEEYEKIVRKVTITNEELMVERSLEAQSRDYMNQEYKCENCLIGFKFEENYDDHVKRKHQEGIIKCEVCQQTLSSAVSLNTHMLRHYTRFECKLCNKRYREHYDAVYHYNKEHPVNVVKRKCHHCDFTTNVLNELKLHSLRHHKMLTCKTCGRLCSNLLCLKIHFAKAHKNKEYSHKCKKCPQTFPTKLDLQRHENIQHIFKYYIRESKYNSYICAFCHRIYKFKNNLIKHLQMHLRKDKNTQVADK